MAKLEKLPDELLVIISEMTQDVRGLASLAKMNRRLNTIATGPLYKQTIDYGSNDTLLWASATGQIGTLELLARHGQDIHAIVPCPYESHRLVYCTVLDNAARHGQARAVGWLLRHGADVNGNVYSSPVRTALLNGKYDVAHVLLSTGNSHFEGYWEDLWCLDGVTVWQRALEAADVSPVLGFPASVVADCASVISNGEVEVAAALSDKEGVIEAVDILLDPVAAIDAYRYPRKKIIRTHIPFDDTICGRISKASRPQEIRMKSMYDWRKRMNADAACASMGKLCHKWGRKQCRGAGCLACHLFNSASANRDRLRR